MFVFTGMAPPALLILLLMSSQLLVFTASQPTKDDAVHVVKKAFNFIIDHREEIRGAITPIFDLIEMADPRIKPAIEIIVLIATGKKPEDKVLKTVVNEFQNLNFKLDKYHREQKWDTWASGAYHKTEIDIKEGYNSYMILLDSLSETNDIEQWQTLKNEFTTSYQKYEPATRTLHELMTATHPTFINNLGVMLADHLKCDQNDTREYSEFVQDLMFKGTFVNACYYKYKNIATSARRNNANKIQHDVASAIFKMQIYCLNQITEYVEMDVKDLIDEKKNRTELANEIRKKLEEKDERYEWMVVAFKSSNSEHKHFLLLNKHILTPEFTLVKKDGITVAVARQLKGKHSKTVQIKSAIDKCLKMKNVPDNLIPCSKVAEKLSECAEKVDTVPMSQTYTAVHAFAGSAHESHSESDNNFVIEGKCFILSLLNGFKGEYHVMLKSDEEIKGNPCQTHKCGAENQGKCVTAGSPSVALCECNYPYYGKTCEKKILET